MPGSKCIIWWRPISGRDPKGLRCPPQWLILIRHQLLFPPLLLLLPRPASWWSWSGGSPLLWRLAGVSINQAFWLEGQPSFVWGVIWMLYTNHTTDDWVRKGKNAVDILAFVSREGRWGLSACCAWTTSGGLSYWHCPGDEGRGAGASTLK